MRHSDFAVRLLKNSEKEIIIYTRETIQGQGKTNEDSFVE
jgi:hypothetical protein